MCQIFPRHRQSVLLLRAPKRRLWDEGPCSCSADVNVHLLGAPWAWWPKFLSVGTDAAIKSGPNLYIQ